MDASKEGRPDEARPEEARFLRHALIAIGLAGAAFLLWKLRFVLILLFGAVLVASIVRAIAAPLQKHLRFPENIAVAVAVLLIFGFVGGTGWLFGTQLSAQTQQLGNTLPGAVRNADAWLGGYGMNHPLQHWIANLHSSGGAIMSDVGGWLTTFSESLANFLIVLSGGIFLALQPRFYRSGAVKLVPDSKRPVVGEAMDESEKALRLWLKGQLIAMVVIGSMAAAGLWLLGIKEWLVLGLLAGTLEFIPFAGPILSAIPGVLLALVQSPELALWTALMYFAVQHLESYLIQPVIQQYAVDIPAVVLLFSLLAFAMLFGIIGILLAAPMAVVAYVMVKRLYVVETLHTSTPIPGEEKD